MADRGGNGGRIDWALLVVVALCGAVPLIVQSLDRAVALPLSLLGILAATVSAVVFVGRSIARAARVTRARRVRPLSECTGTELRVDLADGPHVIWIVDDDPRPAEIVADGVRRSITFPRIPWVGSRRASFPLGLHRAELVQHVDMRTVVGDPADVRFTYNLRIDGRPSSAAAHSRQPYPQA